MNDVRLLVAILVVIASVSWYARRKTARKMDRLNRIANEAIAASEQRMAARKEAPGAHP